MFKNTLGILTISLLILIGCTNDKIGYLVPELYDMRGDWLMALTPGGVDQNLERLGYKRINRPMFPLDQDMKDPDLKARLVPLSGEIE